jgi:hypothetical protein
MGDTRVTGIAPKLGFAAGGSQSGMNGEKMGLTCVSPRTSS